MSEDGVETGNATSSAQETKPKNPATVQPKKRTIEPEIADMIVDPVQVLVPAEDDSDSFTDWTQAN